MSFYDAGMLREWLRAVSSVRKARLPAAAARLRELHLFMLRARLEPRGRAAAPAVFSGRLSAMNPAAARLLLASGRPAEAARALAPALKNFPGDENACGLAAEAVRHFNEAFRGQLERGATTTWEAWRAENHDSRNHAWSAPLPHLVRRGVIGLDPVTPGYGQLRLAPDFAAFDELDATCLIPQGPVRVAWRRIRPDAFALQVAVPKGVKAIVEPLSGGRRAVAGGAWSGTMPAASA